MAMLVRGPIAKPTITNRPKERLGRIWGMRCAVDLRQGVVDGVRRGGSKAEAARRFKVGEASVYCWLKPDGIAYKRPGPRGSRKPDWEQLRRDVAAYPDRT